MSNQAVIGADQYEMHAAQFHDNRRNDAGHDSDAEENEDENEEEEFPEEYPENMADLYLALGLRPPSTNSSMAVSDTERNLAINIKEAIATATDVDPISDFMCVQLALVDGDNTEAAVERAYNLQCFREEYRILDTASDGVRRCAAYFDLMPGFHLSFAEEQSTGRSVAIFDNTKFSGKRIHSEESLRVWLGGTYYTLAVFAPHFQAIRAGTILVAECEGYDWKVDMDFKSLKQVWSEIAAVYPVPIKKIKYFNSGTTMNLVASMLRPFLPRDLQSKIELGCQFDQRLDEIYLTPTLEAANVRMLSRIAALLQQRYENEQAFHL